MEALQNEVASKPVLIDLRQKFKENDPPEVIRIESNLVAQDLWPEMLEQTKKDGYERGVVVFKKGDKIIKSRIFEGRMTEDNAGSISEPFFVHGIRRPFLPRPKDIAFVHTHSMPPDMDHLKTTIISAKDINTFASSSYNVVVAIDRGGVHMLAKRNKHVNEHIDGEIISNDAFTFAKKTDNSTDSVRKSMARKLRVNGYYYFYSPDLKSSPDGFWI